MMDIKLKLGQTVITPGALEKLHPEDTYVGLRRHAKGDWGNVCWEDQKANNQALKEGARILSAYWDRNRTKFWIITEADRSVTTILLPDEY